MDDNLLDSNQNESISMNIKESVRATAPWMKFIGIFFMIVGGIYAIFSIIALFASPLAGLIAIAFSGLYIYLGYLSFKSGSDYSSFLSNSNIASLESSLKNQKTWWTIMGILMIVGVVLGIFAGIFGASLGNQLNSFR